MGKNKLVFVVLTIFLLVGCSDENVGDNLTNSQGSFRLVESDGTEFVSDEIPERIIVLSVATAEIMDNMGIELVGITRTNRSLEGNLKELPNVGFAMEPSIESIIALEPDLVIISSDFKDRHKDKMVQNNIPVYFIDNQAYEDTYKSIETLGEAFNKQERAQEMIEEMKVKEEEILAQVESNKGDPPKVLILFGAGESFLMARETSYAGGMVEMLGGENIAKDMEVKLSGEYASYLPISIEEVVRHDPDIILRISHGTAEASQRLYEEEFSKNVIWHSVSAHKNNRVYDLSQELFFANPGLKVVDALEELAHILYRLN